MDIGNRINNYNKFIEETLDYIYDIKGKLPSGEQRFETYENITRMLNSIDTIIQYVSKKKLHVNAMTMTYFYLMRLSLRYKLLKPS